MSGSIRLLLVEDNVYDAQLVLDELKRAGYEVHCRRVSTEADFLAQLDPDLDIILSDYGLPRFNGSRALDLAKQRYPDIPFILISGTIGEDIAVSAMKRGAADYLLKDRLARLGAAVEHALEEGRMRKLNRRAEEAIAGRLRLEETLSEMAATVPGALYVVREKPDGSAGFSYASPKLKELTGFAAEDLAADTAPFWAAVHPDDLAATQQSLREAFRQMDPWAGTYRFRHPERGFIWLQAHATPHREANGGVLWRGFMHDVTERRQLEDQLLNAQKMEAIGSLAGGIAHDFNNILNVILGNVEMAQEALPPGPVHRQLHEIERAGHRARDLAQQLLAFSRRRRPEPVVVSLEPLINETVGFLRALCPPEVQLVKSISPDAPNILADATQIHQVLTNLCTNAWHAMADEIGRIEIDLANLVLDAEGGRPLHLPPGRYAHLSVRDTGHGMSPDLQQRIFEPFFTTKPPDRGTGLGLSIVRSIVQAHHGVITVQSEPGQGSLFQIYFPAAEAEAAPPRIVEKVVYSGRGQHILCIDDVASMVSLSVYMLKHLGYEVTGATSPAEALAAFRENPERFDLVMTDMNMPGFSGLTLAEELLKIRPGLPIILDCGDIDDALRARAAEVGIRHVLRKPVTLEELSAALHAFVPPPRRK